MVRNCQQIRSNYFGLKSEQWSCAVVVVDGERCRGVVWGELVGVAALVLYGGVPGQWALRRSARGGVGGRAVAGVGVWLCRGGRGAGGGRRSGRRACRSV